MDADQKRMVVVVAVIVALVVAWGPVTNLVAGWLGYDLTPEPETAEVTQAPDPDEPVARVTEEAGAGRVAGADGPGESVVLGSAAAGDETHAIAVELSPIGAGVSAVTLNDFKAEVDGDEPYVFETAAIDELPDSHPLRTRAVILDGERHDLGGVTWELTESSATSATYGVTITDADGGPLVRVNKTFAVTPRTDPGEGYEVLLTHEVENLTDTPRTAQLVLNGPTTPPAELEDRPDRQVLAGFFDEGEFEIEQHIVSSLDTEGTGLTLGSAFGDDAVFAWAGTSTIYFQALVRPELTDQQRADRQIPPAFEDVTLRVLNPEEENGRLREVALSFTTRPLKLPAAGSAELPLRVFFGPKKRSMLTGEYYDSLVTRFAESLIAPVGCTICVFAPIVNVLNALLRFFHAITGDWGLAIIGLVLVVKALLHPITKRAQLSMMIAGKRMQKIAPELKRLKEKYGDDQAGYAKAAMAVQRENFDAKQFLGCLPIFLQTPIWIALYQSLQTTFELRHAPFLYGVTWIDDLSRPDHLIDFGQSYSICPLFGLSVSGLNLLPILLGVVFWINMQIQPQPTQALSPEQEQQQKLMKTIFPLVFPIFLYSAPSGLNIYILTSTLIGIIESKLVRRSFKLKEAAIDAEPLKEVDLDAEPEKVVAKPKKGGKPEKKKGFWANIVEQAETMQKEIEAKKAQQAKAAKKRKK